MSEADHQSNQEPKSALDAAEEACPEKTGWLFGRLSQWGKILTREDLINNLTRSRTSNEDARKERGRGNER